MLKRIGAVIGMLLGVVCLALLPGNVALAQAPTPRHTDPYWQVSYWNNTSLSGAPVVQLQDTNLDHDWGSGSPDTRINADYFSARWTRYISVTPATYRFTAIADDGIRVWVDDELIIDQWREQAASTFTADRYLDSGHHLVKVEYYEQAGRAVARFSWTQAPAAIQYWRGEYFNNKSLSGPPGLVRDDREINFSWGTGSPAPGAIDADGFSVRWTDMLNLSAGSYRFSMTVDDGARLFVNGHLLIDAWKDQAATAYTGDIYLPGGEILVQMEYYENSGDAVARLSWSRQTSPPATPAPTPTPTPMPTPSAAAVIVDDLDAGFVKGGSASGWATAPEGYNGHLTWTQNNDYARPGYNWGRWYPNLKAGRYQVSVYIPQRYSTTGGARYWISHAGGFTLRVVDQSANGGRWVSLGTYSFRGAGQDYVSLADVTYEPRLSRLMAWDAVKWEPR